jgi:hypothetical protein
MDGDRATISTCRSPPCEVEHIRVRNVTPASSEASKGVAASSVPEITNEVPDDLSTP